MSEERPVQSSLISGRTLLMASALFCAWHGAFADEMRTVKGLATPESVLVGPRGRIYISEIGEFGKDGDGKISVVGRSGNAEPFATGLDDPKGLAIYKHTLYAADKVRIWKIDSKGAASVFVKAEDFPQAPQFLNDLVADAKGNLYVSDSGDIEKGGKGAIFKVTPAGKVSMVTSEAKNPSIKSPNGLLLERSEALLVVDFASGELLRVNIGTGAVEKIADGFGGGDGLGRDAAGTLYVSDWKGGRVWKFNPKKQGAKPEAYEQTFKASADFAVSSDGRYLIVPDMKAGTVSWLLK
jgi:gluconolactonase